MSQQVQYLPYGALRAILTRAEGAEAPYSSPPVPASFAKRA